MHIKCKNNIDFFWKNVERNQRLDGRALFDSRNISIYFLRNYGNSIITIGNTKVVCTIKAEIVEPTEKKPNEGIVRIHIDTDSFNHIMDNSKTNEECIEIRSIIDKTLKSSKTLNFESLCIIPHKKVWCLYINVTVLEHDGNIVDACFLAAYSSLVHFRKTEIKIDESLGNYQKLNISETESFPLSVHNIPVLSTFAYFEKHDTFMLDPASYEQDLMSAHFSVALNKNGKLINVLKTGGSPISYSRLCELIKIAEQRVPFILKILQDAIEEDRNTRNKIKKSNLNIIYSCKPVRVKYSEEMENVLELKKSIAVDQTTIFEKLFEAYANAERDDIDQNEDINYFITGSEERRDGSEREQKEKEKKGEREKTEKCNSFFKQKKQKKSSDIREEASDKNYIIYNNDHNKMSQKMMQVALGDVKRVMNEAGDFNDNSDIMKIPKYIYENEKEGMHINYENSADVIDTNNNIFSPLCVNEGKEQKEMWMIKRQEMFDRGNPSTNKYFKTEAIDSLVKCEPGLQAHIKSDIDHVREKPKEIEHEIVDANNEKMINSHLNQQKFINRKKKITENTISVPLKIKDDSSSDVDFSIAINESLATASTTTKKKKKKK